MCSKVHYQHLHTHLLRIKSIKILKKIQVNLKLKYHKLKKFPPLTIWKLVSIIYTNYKHALKHENNAMGAHLNLGHHSVLVA